MKFGSYSYCYVWLCSVFETSLPRELPIVYEITTVLREWHHLWKELYLVSLILPLISLSRLLFTSNSILNTKNAVSASVFPQFTFMCF